MDLEIGCLVDLAMGMLSFSANGRELGTCYQVGVASGTMTVASQAWVLRALLGLPPRPSRDHMLRGCVSSIGRGASGNHV